MYNKITDEDIKVLKSIVGEDNVIAGNAINPDYAHDELGTVERMPDVLVKVQTVPIDKKQNEGAIKLENATEIARNSDYCYMVAIGTSKNETAVAIEEFKNMFKVLD